MPDELPGTWFGYDGEELARHLDLPLVRTYGSVGSTMDVAHALAADGSPRGTLVLAESQRVGRGRSGRAWVSEQQRGVWLTWLERPHDPTAPQVLSLRVGLHLAEALAPFVDGTIGVKWPNDLLLERAKLAGILAEARWRGLSLDWIAIGVGVNLSNAVSGAALRPGSDPFEVLHAVVNVLRDACRAAGPLTPGELDALRRRDVATGRRARAPVPGRVAGVTAAGDLLIEGTDGVHEVRSGSLDLEEWP